MTSPHRAAGRDIRIQRADPRDPSVDAVIERHLDLMRAVSPPDSVFAQDAVGLVQDGARLFVASDDSGLVLGIGAYKLTAPDHAELKSMHVVAEARGRKIGAALLEHILREARQEGATRASLETGSAAAFGPAISLYRSHGFVDCAAFPPYAENPFSLFLTKDLTGPS